MGSVPSSAACQLCDLGQTISPPHAWDSPSENGDVPRVSAGLSIGEMVRGRGSPQERGVCISRGEWLSWGHIWCRGAKTPSPSLPVSLCLLRLRKGFVDRRPWRWGWGKDRVGLLASLPASPQPLRLRVLSLSQRGLPCPHPWRAWARQTPGQSRRQSQRNRSPVGLC